MPNLEIEEDGTIVEIDDQGSEDTTDQLEIDQDELLEVDLSDDDEIVSDADDSEEPETPEPDIDDFDDDAGWIDII